MFYAFFFRCSDVAAFIGPEGPTCHTAAMVAGSKNRAMISYKCSDAEVSDKNKFPTFTRMEPPDTQVTNSVLSLLNHYNWKRFTIVCQKGAQFETIGKKKFRKIQIKKITKKKIIR